MNTDLIILLTCSLTTILTVYNFFKVRSEQNYSLLHLRIRKLEHTVSCLQSYIRINSPSFGDKMDEITREFEKKLNENKDD